MLLNNNEYLKIMESIKSEIKSAQYKAAVSVNRELIMLYYNIGCVINDHKIWGNKFIENLAADIRMEFPGVTGYSVRNLKYMAKFAAKFSDIEIVQAVLAQLSVSTKSTTLSKDKRNHCGKALFCVFPPIPPFQRKTAPQAALPLLTAVFLFKESLRRRMSACGT